MSTQTLNRPASYELLADLPTGARFFAGGKAYTMSDGCEIQPAAHQGWFNATDSAGARVRVKVGARTLVTIVGRRY